MSSKAITEKKPGPEGEWQPAPEKAPSQVSKDEPTFARAVGMLGLMMVSLGSVALLVAAMGRTSRLVGPNWGAFLLIVGMASLLFHAVRDADLQVRRTYAVIGYLWLVVGIAACFVPFQGVAGVPYLPIGVPGFILALLFLLPALRNETEESWRRAGLVVLGLAALGMAGTGFIGGNISEAFLLPNGLLLAVLGLAYAWAFLGLQGPESDTGYWATIALGFTGQVALIVAVGRSSLPQLYHKMGWLLTTPESYLVPSGLLLSVVGLAYILLAVGLLSDNTLVVLVRRELAAFFFSPVAYIVLFGLTLVGVWMFFMFVRQLIPPPGQFMQTQALREPIIRDYFISLWPIIAVILGVPVLTMRLLSEEQRSGTLEVLLTAPVTETTIVLSKFLAVFIFFMLSLSSWAMFLIAFRVEGGQPFEYRPLLSFYLALGCSAAGFLSMGLFFSSLTRNQIASALLSAVGMLAMTALAWGEVVAEQMAQAERMKQPEGANQYDMLSGVLGHSSYLNLWVTAMRGEIMVPFMVFHLSVAVFWLFLTVKVLESRRWR